jgi:lysophospholipid acyltransferase (LPLAT)-like uncharacterized protein
VVVTGKAIRRLRFYLLERLVLPLAMWPLRAWLWSWRTSGPDPSLIADVLARQRVIFTIFHGTLLEGLVYQALWRAHGRRWVVLTTPSLDGQFAAAMLDRVGVGCAPLVPGARGVAAAREFVARVAQGDIGVILVDGPRGPRGVVKPGVARTIEAARADVVAAGLWASRGIRFNSWDRTYLPAPFARVHLCCHLLAPPAAGAAHDGRAIQAALEAACAEAQRALQAEGRR